MRLFRRVGKGPDVTPTPHHAIGAVLSPAFLSFWKTASIVLSGTFGSLALLTHYRDQKTSRITAWGYLALFGLIVSACGGVLAQVADADLQRHKDQIERGRQLDLTTKAEAAARNASEAAVAARGAIVSATAAAVGARTAAQTAQRSVTAATDAALGAQRVLAPLGQYTWVTFAFAVDCASERGRVLCARLCGEQRLATCQARNPSAADAKASAAGSKPFDITITKQLKHPHFWVADLSSSPKVELSCCRRSPQSCANGASAERAPFFALFCIGQTMRERRTNVVIPQSLLDVAGPVQIDFDPRQLPPGSPSGLDWENGNGVTMTSDGPPRCGRAGASTRTCVFSLSLADDRPKAGERRPRARAGRDIVRFEPGE